jgi:polyisoprenoid-binding protein YceI
MSRRNLTYLVAALVIFGLGALTGVLGYIYMVGGSGEPSATLSAPTLALNATATPLPATTAPTAESTPATTAAANDSASLTGQGLFRISPDKSQVSFTLTEKLVGRPNTVVGTTNQVAGDVIVNFDTPASSQIGQIRIDARTLTTDTEMRNRAIRTQILQSAQDQYEFIEFTPKTLSGLPDKVEIGTPVQFQVTGDLKIRDIVKSVTFDATATLVSPSELQGSAKTTVKRGDFNLTIPNAPGVADVAEEVALEIDFVAAAVQE